MLQDLLDQIKALSQAQRDKEAQAQAKLDQDIAGVQGSANDQVSSMNSGLSDELDTLGNQIQSTSERTASQTQQAKDSYTAQIAGIQADSGQSSLTAVNAISDASSASQTLGDLNAARLQAVSDASQAQLNQVGSTVMGALTEARDAGSEIESEFGQRNRALEMSAGQQVADATAKNSQTLNQLAQNVDGDFKDVQDSTLRTQQLSQDQLMDMKNALTAMASGSDAVGSKTADLENALKGMGSEQLMQMQQLLSQLGTSESAIDSTATAAESKLKQAVAAQLQERMSALQMTLTTNAKEVSGSLTAAEDDIKNTADKVNKATSVASGNYDKTSADLNALMATLGNAGGDISNSAKSLQALLGSMTDKEVVDFKIKIAQLASDSRSSENNLRAYLTSMIQNKTDSAQSEAQSVFLTNQQALTAALNSASSEISKTKDLAAQALLDNDVVRRNSTLLLREFIDTEQRLSNLSNSHTDILNELQKNITDWKADIIKRINDIEANITKGSAELPSYAEERLKNITLLVSMNQDDLKGFLAQFQDSLDEAKAIQDHFQDSQSGRIIAAMTGVSQAIATATVRMASQATQSDMSANEKARALSTILSELCESIDKANADATASDSAIAARVRDMTSKVNGTVGDISRQVNQMVTNLATDKLHKDISLSKSMENAVTDAGVGINASANAIELAQRSIHKAVEKSAAGWANNNKEVYTLGGFLFSLSQESQQKLLYILQELQHGRLTMDQALAMARQADISQIKSAQDVVAVLVGAMDGYDATVQSIFGNSFDRLETASKSLSGRVDDMVGDLVTLASVLDYNSSMLAHRVEKFSNISDAFIGTAQTNVSDLETYIFNQQAEVTRALSGLNSLMDYSEKDVSLRQQQFNNWIDSLIANETTVITDKTTALRTALLGKTASSFADVTEPKSTAKKNMEVLKAEMMELDRRRHKKSHLRTAQHTKLDRD